MANSGGGSGGGSGFSPWSLIAAPIGGAFQYAGAKKQASAAKHAADVESQAANHAADVKARSDAETLAWQKQQADNTAKQAEIDRKANYDQWAAQQSERNTVRAALGYPTMPIPAYVPSAPVNFTDAPSGPSPSGPNAPTRDPNQLAPGWTQNPDGTFRFAPNGGPSPTAGPNVPTPASVVNGQPPPGTATRTQPQTGPMGAPPPQSGGYQMPTPRLMAPPNAPNYLPMPGQPGYQPYSINSYLMGAR